MCGESSLQSSTRRTDEELETLSCALPCSVSVTDESEQIFDKTIERMLCLLLSLSLLSVGELQNEHDPFFPYCP